MIISQRIIIHLYRKILKEAIILAGQRNYTMTEIGLGRGPYFEVNQFSFFSMVNNPSLAQKSRCSPYYKKIYYSWNIFQFAY